MPECAPVTVDQRRVHALNVATPRPVFGTVRYMSYNGCRLKFDVDGYIERVEKLI